MSSDRSTGIRVLTERVIVMQITILHDSSNHQYQNQTIGPLHNQR